MTFQGYTCNGVTDGEREENRSTLQAT